LSRAGARVTPEFLRAFRKRLTSETGILHRSKGTSHLMRFAAKRLVRSFGMKPKTFMERFSTVVWIPVVRRPVAFYNWRLGSPVIQMSLRSRLIVFAHEGTHAYQMRRGNDPRKWSLTYGMDSEARANAELEAYQVSLSLSLLTTETHFRSTIITEPPLGYASVAEYAEARAHAYADTVDENYNVGRRHADMVRRELLRTARVTIANRRPPASAALSALRATERLL